MPKVKFHKADNPYLGISSQSWKNKDIEELVDSIRSVEPIIPQEIDIELHSTSVDSPIFLGELNIEEDANFDDLEVKEENLTKLTQIAESIARLLQDPKMIFKNLKDLDQSIGQIMRKEGIELSDNKPQYLIAGPGSFLPGPWPENYKPLRKGKTLHHELLRREQEHGINLNGVPVFRGFVRHEEANNIVGSGNIFTEDEQSGRFLLHGKYSHRLFFELVREAEKSGDLDLEVDGKSLTQKQLLQLMTSTWGETSETEASTWSLLIDFLLETESRFRGSDESELRENALSPDNYCFSSRSPLVFKSLITCFGAEELPNLSAYLLDSHYKQVAMMIYKVRQNSGKKLDHISDETLYTSCMDALLTGVNFLPQNIEGRFDFLADNKDYKFERFDPKYPKNIARKKDRSENEIGRYESVIDYIREKTEMFIYPKSPSSVSVFESITNKALKETNDPNRQNPTTR